MRTVNGYEIKPHADLRYADLRWADLRWADLRWADLSDADLRGADLRNANLLNADLQSADLRRADLRDANLKGADLLGAQLYTAKGVPEYVKARLSILPEGDLIGWKKCKGQRLVKLLIPASARRSNATGRKCRAEFANVLEVIGPESVAYSTRLNSQETDYIPDNRLSYREGETVRPDSWDDDWTIECGHGIHFFITRQEAEDWVIWLSVLSGHSWHAR